jgi:hypothetical protein
VKVALEAPGATYRSASGKLSPISAMHTGMIPPAATPPRTRLMKSTVRSGARADASRHSQDGQGDLDHHDLA